MEQGQTVYLVVLFVETPRKFITAKLSILKPGSSSVLIICNIFISANNNSTDEDPGLQIESFAVINLLGVSTNKTIIYFIAMQTYKRRDVFAVMPMEIACREVLEQQHYDCRGKI
jgi:hypothetical protein